jgi:hypothetical protein
MNFTLHSDIRVLYFCYIFLSKAAPRVRRAWESTGRARHVPRHSDVCNSSDGADASSGIQRIFANSLIRARTAPVISETSAGA